MDMQVKPQEVNMKRLTVIGSRERCFPTAKKLNELAKQGKVIILKGSACGKSENPPAYSVVMKSQQMGCTELMLKSMGVEVDYIKP